jgi:hypothetical protein
MQTARTAMPGLPETLPRNKAIPFFVPFCEQIWGSLEDYTTGVPGMVEIGSE